MQYFDLLPDEILKKIFSYVFEFTHCNLVCKRFHIIINNMIKGLNEEQYHVYEYVPDKCSKIYSNQTIDCYNLDNMRTILYEKYKDCINNDDLFQINCMFCKLRLFYDLHLHKKNVGVVFDGLNIYFDDTERGANYSSFLIDFVFIQKWNNLSKKHIKNKKSVINFICNTNKIRESIYKKHR